MKFKINKIAQKLTVFAFFLINGYLASAQTTVTLEDQCNCEVLKGTEVTAAGATAPTGAEPGDLYVNTDTGAMYYWDGDSWEIANLAAGEWADTNLNGLDAIYAKQAAVAGDTILFTDNGKLLMGTTQENYVFEDYFQDPKVQIQNKLDYEDADPSTALDLYYGSQVKTEVLNAGTATNDVFFGTESVALSNQASSTDMTKARLRGAVGQAFHYGDGELGTAVGGGFSAKNFGTGTINNAYGITLFGIQNKSTGVINNAFGINIPNQLQATNSTAINIGGNTYGTEKAYGIKIGNVSGASLENYSIYTNNGRVSIGDTLQLRNTVGAPLTDILDTDEGIAIVDAEGNVTKRDASVLSGLSEWADVSVNGTDAIVAKQAAATGDTLLITDQAQLIRGNLVFVDSLKAIHNLATYTGNDSSDEEKYTEIATEYKDTIAGTILKADGGIELYRTKNIHASSVMGYIDFHTERATDYDIRLLADTLQTLNVQKASLNQSINLTSELNPGSAGYYGASFGLNSDDTFTDNVNWYNGLIANAFKDGSGNTASLYGGIFRAREEANQTGEIQNWRGLGSYLEKFGSGTNTGSAYAMESYVNINNGSSGQIRFPIGANFGVSFNNGSNVSVAGYTRGFNAGVNINNPDNGTSLGSVFGGMIGLNSNQAGGTHQTVDNAELLRLGHNVNFKSQNNLTGLRITNINGGLNNYAIYTDAGSIRFGDVPADANPNDVVTIDNTGVLKKTTRADLAASLNNNPWDNPDGTVADQSSTNIGYNAGNVGIGMTDANTTLGVNGDFTTYRVGSPVFPNNLETDIQSLYHYVDDANAVFVSEQDENIGQNGGFNFIMDDDGTANPAFRVMDKNDQLPLLRVQADGKVGINTNSPAGMFEVNGSILGATAGDAIELSRLGGLTNNSTSLRTTLRRHTDGTSWTTSNIRTQQVVDVTPFSFIDYGIDGQVPSNGLGFGFGTETHMALTAQGNLGIGTTSPNSDIEVFAPGNEAAQIGLSQEDADAHFMLRTDGAGTTFLSNKNNFVGNGSTGNTDLMVIGQNSVQLRYGDTGSVGDLGVVLENTGNLAVGGITGATEKLDVDGTARLRGLADNNDPLDKVVVASTDGVLMQLSKADLAETLNNNPWDNPDGTVATQASTDIGYVGGNVGVGTNEPSTRFEIASETTPDDRLAFYSDENNRFRIQTLLDGNTLADYPYGGGSNRLSLQPLGGFVGIGIEEPQVQLHVSNSMMLEAAGNAIMTLKGKGTGNFNGNFLNMDISPNAGYENFARFLFTFNKGTTASPSLSLQRRTADNQFKGSIISYDDDEGLRFYSTSDPTVGTTQRMEIAEDGNVGINVLNATNRLHVVSASNPVRFEGLQDDTDPANKLVVSDVNGVLKTLDQASISTTSPIRTETADYTVAVADGTILVDATGGDVTVTLPAPATGKKLTIKKIDTSTNAVVMNGAGATIDGTPTRTNTVPYKTFVLQSDGANWFIVN